MKRLVCCLLLAAAVIIGGGRCRANNNEVGVRVIVIDAGHGGKAFPGATYGGVKEKDINLAVALKLGALIEKELPQIKVVYTRKTDTALGKTLNEDLTARANIANKAGLLHLDPCQCRPGQAVGGGCRDHHHGREREGDALQRGCPLQ